jgi:hypothetical protein
MKKAGQCSVAIDSRFAAKGVGIAIEGPSIIRVRVHADGEELKGPGLRIETVATAKGLTQ